MPVLEAAAAESVRAIPIRGRWFVRVPRVAGISLAWFVPLAALAAVGVGIAQNVIRGGVGIGFDNLSYVCVFRDLMESATVRSPFTTPKVLPILMLGGLFRVSGSLGLVALLEGLVGLLCLLAVYRVGRRIGLTPVLSLWSVGLFACFRLDEIISGNASVWATMLSLFAIDAFASSGERLSRRVHVLLFLAALVRPEPMLLALLLAATLVIVDRTGFPGKGLGQAAGLLIPVALAVAVQLAFEYLVFGDPFYSSRQLHGYGASQVLGARSFPELTGWDLPPSWARLAASLDAGPLMSQGIVATLASAVLILLGLGAVHGERTRSRLVVALLIAVGVAAAVAYGVLGVVIYPRFFLLFSAGLCILIGFGLKVLGDGRPCPAPRGIRIAKMALMIALVAPIIVAGSRTLLRYGREEPLRVGKIRDMIALYQVVERDFDLGRRLILSKSATPAIPLLFDVPVDRVIPLNWVAGVPGLGEREVRGGQGGGGGYPGTPNAIGAVILDRGDRAARSVLEKLLGRDAYRLAIQGSTLDVYVGKNVAPRRAGAPP